MTENSPYQFENLNITQRVIAVKALIDHQKSLINVISECKKIHNNNTIFEEIKNESQRKLNELNETLYTLGIASHDGIIIQSKVPP